MSDVRGVAAVYSRLPERRRRAGLRTGTGESCGGARHRAADEDWPTSAWHAHVAGLPSVAL